MPREEGRGHEERGLASGRQLLGLECESNPGCVANELRDLWGWGTLG